MSLRIAACLAAVTAAMLAALPASAQEQIRLGHNRTWSNPALIIGLGTGAFDKAGVHVAEREFTNPADIITAIASGDLDAGAAPGATLFASVLRGVKVKAVALLQGDNTPPISYKVLSDSGIASVADLRGKKAAVNNYGGVYDIYLRYWVAKFGLDPKKDLDILVVPVPAMLPSLINHQIDIAPLASFDQALAEQKYPGKTRTLFSYDDVVQDGIGNTHNNSIVLVMADKFIADHRDTAIKFLTGYLRAVHGMNADPKAALASWAKIVGNPALANLPRPPTVPDDGKVYPDGLQFDADQAVRFGYLDRKIDTSDMVDNSLIDAAARALR